MRLVRQIEDYEERRIRRQMSVALAAAAVFALMLLAMIVHRVTGVG